jgi:hypothetical protein
MFEMLCLIAAIAGAVLTFVFVMGPVLPDWFRW